MANLQKLFVLAVPLLLLALTVVAGYAYSQVRYLSLPISQALGLFTVVLPLITGVSNQGAHGLIQRSSKKESYHLTIPLVAVIGFQLIYETIIATLAATYIVPPSSLTCGLDQRWQFLYREKNEKAIRTIQDSFDCCGFTSVLDRAYPFPTNGSSECSDVYGREKSCLAEWREAEQTNAGLFLLVAIVVFVIKVISILLILTGPYWEECEWAHPSSTHSNVDVEQPEEDSRADMRRLIEESLGQADDEEDPVPENTGRGFETPPGIEQAEGPRSEQSSLLDTGNEWRNDEGGPGSCECAGPAGPPGITRHSAFCPFK